MSEVIDHPTTSTPAALHPDILRLMRRHGYYLQPGEPYDVRAAMDQLRQEDEAWTAHNGKRKYSPVAPTPSLT